jgi:hypothetical protein
LPAKKIQEGTQDLRAGNPLDLITDNTGKVNRFRELAGGPRPTAPGIDPPYKIICASALVKSQL